MKLKKINAFLKKIGLFLVVQVVQNEKGDIVEGTGIYFQTVKSWEKEGGASF